MTDKNQLLRLLKSNNLSILSTADTTGKTESAVMAHTVKDDFTILMSSEESSRKIRHIKVNNQVSVVVGGLKNDPSLQIDGLAKILEDQEKTEAIKYILATHPELKDYGIESGCIFSITPIWIRFSDFSKNPPEIQEITL